MKLGPVTKGYASSSEKNTQMKNRFTRINSSASSALSNLAQAETYIGGKLGYTSIACYLNEPCDDESFAISGHIGTTLINTLQLNTVDGEMCALTSTPKFNLHS